MGDYTSISVPQDVKTELESDKPDDMGWGEYLTSLKNNSAFAQSNHESITESEPQGMPDIEPVHEELSQLSRKLEDMRSQLPRKVAQEVRNG